MLRDVRSPDLRVAWRVESILQNQQEPSLAVEASAREARSAEGAILLPRLPMGLQLVSGMPLYKAVAAVCRTLGRLACCQGPPQPAIDSYSVITHPGG